MIAGRKVVVTGAIPGHSRQTAQAALREAGAFVQDALSKETDLLITGARVGASKMTKARERGIQIVTWEEAWGGEREEVDEAVAKARPRQIAPMLAKKADSVPHGQGWLYEVKWDGYRCIATVEEGGVSMTSRSGKSEYSEDFPKVAKALAALDDCVIDGELVVMEANGDHSLQTIAGNGKGARGCLIVFDVLMVRGLDVRRMALSDRKQVLEDLIGPHVSPQLQISPTFDDAEDLLMRVQGTGVEGVVAKLRRSAYYEGSRGGDWLKIKFRLEQEFMVVGWQEGEGARAGMIGALHLAVNGGTGIEYVGKVGTGGTDDEWNAIKDELDGDDYLVLPEGYAGKLGAGMAPRDFRVVTWVAPRMVVQVRFQRWTENGKVFHASLQGVRRDKDAGEVVRES